VFNPSFLDTILV